VDIQHISVHEDTVQDQLMLIDMFVSKRTASRKMAKRLHILVEIRFASIPAMCIGALTLTTWVKRSSTEQFVAVEYTGNVFSSKNAWTLQHLATV